MSKFKALKVTEVRKETASAVSILFDVPEDLKESYAFLPGQYITLKLNIEGKEIRRSYSICSAPYENELRVAVKAVANGVFSNYALNTLKAGDTLEVAAPEGKFSIASATSHQRNYMAFAAGSGITPVISMVKDVLFKELHSTFVLVYGNKTSGDVIFNNEIEQLQKKYPNRLTVQLVYSQKISEGAILGRIDKGVVNHLLKTRFKDTDFYGFYLCGPETMIETVTETIKENNEPGSKIHFELFTPTYTSGAVTTKTLDGDAEVTVILDDEESTFSMSKKKYLLTGAIDEELDPPYSCQGGICSSCMARVTEGEAVMDKNAILTEEEIDEGLILTCQAHPKTDKITIDFDDV
jgi:ring-1,2-phenylacetyl-CoA epoxidase subunit PaaE